jgi:hypothetical protein
MASAVLVELPVLGSDGKGTDFFWGYRPGGRGAKDVLRSAASRQAEACRRVPANRCPYTSKVIRTLLWPCQDLGPHRWQEHWLSSAPVGAKSGGREAQESNAGRCRHGPRAW